MMGKVLYEISKDIIKKARPVAAYLLQAEESTINFFNGKFKIEATGQELTIQEIAASYSKFNQTDKPLFSEFFQNGRLNAYPYGASGAEIEIEPETGELEIIRYGVIDDCGRAINPMIVHGQTHGGIVQGAGQAIGECAFFDENSGQLLSGSFMDYMLPRADQFPLFDIGTMEIRTNTNPLSVKGGGEAGTVPALAVVANAVLDALSPLKIEHFDMPYTASRIWEEIKKVS
jgi:carbon-monoxide dehydrogenase large subunit